jgi:hypothetical protein
VPNLKRSDKKDETTIPTYHGDKTERKVTKRVHQKEKPYQFYIATETWQMIQKTTPSTLLLGKKENDQLIGNVYEITQ